MRSLFFLLLFLLCVLGVPCASIAQTNQAAWTSLSGLHAGQHIQLIDLGGAVVGALLPSYGTIYNAASPWRAVISDPRPTP